MLATLSAFALASGWLFIKYSRKGVIVYRINSGIYLLMLCYLLIYGGHGGSKVLWIYTFPLVSFFLFGKGEGTIWSAVTITILSVLLYYPDHIINIYPYHSEFKIRLIASYATVTGIAFWLEHLRYHYSTSLEDKNKALNDEIVERKKIEKQHQQLMLEVQAANQAKSEFIANMSHEIRTPLNGVIGMTSMLLDTKLDKSQQHYANTLRNSGEFLLTIINDILDVSKIEAGKFELNIRPFKLREMLDRFVDIVTRKIYKNNVELVVWAEPTIPSCLSGDVDRLQQILLNLTSNALKFTPEGNVTVKVSRHDETQSHITLRFSVKDTGIGIAQDDQSKLFHSYSQIDTPTTREYCGTGLGLNISKQLCHQMGGSIGVNSSIGKGSEFWFITRFEKDLQEIDDEISSPPLHGKSTLVATENDIRGEMIEAYLTHWGASVQRASSPEILLQNLRETADREKPILLIIDQTYIEASSANFFEQLLELINIEKQQLILLQEENEPIQNVSETDFKHIFIINKPIRYWELKSLCSNRKILYTEVTSSVPAPTQTSPKKLSWDKYNILLAEDNPINTEVLLGLLNKIGLANVDTVENGIEVLSALEKKTYQLILMDISMPKMNGITATEKIRNDTFTANSNQIPIIALTAHAIAGDREKCLKAGMNDYLTKPVNPEDLLYKLEIWLQTSNGKTTETNEASMTPQSTTHFEDLTQFDYNALLNRMLGDEELVRGVLKLSFTEVPEQLEQLSESINARDYENSGKRAHKLAGGLANLAMNRMHAMAKEIQHQCKDQNLERIEELLSLLNSEFEEVQHTVSQLS
ncbi:hypothetical protein LA52FAK_41730 [Desulforhopalus sp. 52FAK]